MSVFIDTLAQIITESISDAEATREDWQKAVDQAFANEETLKLSETICGRHGGRWGDDETCQDCTDIDGNPRPLPADADTCLDPLQLCENACTVTWVIDADEDISPAQAAINVWQENFRRGTGRPGPDEACVFTITNGSRSTQLDLFDERFAHLFQ